jgi:hypothetical protein
MQRRTIAALVALELVVACGYAVAADAPATAAVAPHDKTEKTDKPDELSLRLTPRFVSAPGYLRSLIRVTPNADNRVLRVEIDSAGYYRSSDIQLEGASAPMSHFLDWKAVPAGKYDMIVSVLGASGDARLVRTMNFQVLGMEAEQ